MTSEVWVLVQPVYGWFTHLRPFLPDGTVGPVICGATFVGTQVGIGPAEAARCDECKRKARA